jgi:hypothetical protein
MRTPSPPFRAALVAYRRTIVEKQSPGPERELVLQVLKRWDDAGATEEIWKAITDASLANGMPPPEAAEFIEWLISTRLTYEKLSHVIEQTPAVTTRLRVQVEREWRGPVNVWPGAAGKRAAVEAHEARMDAVLGRKKAGAPRKRFMKLLRDAFIANCGRPLNNVVAALTEIAFGPDTTEGAVRGTQRPTKRRERGP